MKLKICSPHCGAEPQSQSGGEVYERELLRTLGEGGDEVHVILARHKQAPSGVAVVHRPPVRRGLRWWVTPFVWPPSIAYCWRRCGGFDLLRAHSVRYAGPSCLAARAWLRLPVPVVTHIHHLDPDPLNRWIERPVLRASDLVITDSEAARNQLTGELGIPEDTIRVVRSGIADRYRPDPEAARDWPMPGRRVIAACGQLIERKDPRFALRVMAGLHRRGYGESVVLVWIGGGPMEAQVKAEAEAAGLGEMVRFPGYVTEAVKLAIINRCEVFLHTSFLEGFALAPQEAMACGKPVVIRRAASAEEMVQHGVQGYVEDTEDGFVWALAQLLDRSELRAAMGAAAQVRAEAKFRWKYTMRGVRAAYEEAVQAHNRIGGGSW